MPLHLWLTLSDAKSTVPYGYTDDRRQLVAATLLNAIRIAELVDIDASVKWLYRNQ